MIVAADNLHALNPVVADALKRLDPQPLQEIVRRCEKSGANLIDLNPGYLPPRHEDRMVFMVEAVQEFTTKRLILDSPNPRVLAKGLAVCRDLPIINALTLEEKKLKEILPLAVEYRTDLVVLLLDNHSVTPASMDEKLALAVILHQQVVAAGLAEEHLIFDPVLPNLAWHDAFYRVKEVLRTIRMLDEGTVFARPVPTMVGLSNLRSGQKRNYPRKLEEICLAMLAGAGLQYVLLDVLQPDLISVTQMIKQMS
jgi:5-methyltetrahydrofolate corrinoid/iron sulfur protein methyltransferase